MSNIGTTEEPGDRIAFALCRHLGRFRRTRGLRVVAADP
jgi:hypothetical protein